MSNRGVRRVVIVSSVPISEPVVKNRITPFLKGLLDIGHAVTLVCPRGQEIEGALEAGVDYCEVPVDFVKPKGFIRRAIKEVHDVLKIMECAKKIKADAWLITIPSMFLAFLAPYSLSNRKVFLDVRDLTWEYLSDEIFVQRFSKIFFRRLFKRSLNFFKLVSATNSTEISYIENIWQGERPPLLITNGIARDQYERLRGLGATGNAKTTVSYIGNVGLAQRLDTLVEAAEQLPDVEFRIVGSGIDLDRIAGLVRQKKLDNLVLVGRVGWDSVREYYSKSDILYAQLTRDYAGAMPSKLYEYLATGKYVIYGGCGQALNVLSSFENNQVVNPCDVSALVEAIRLYDSEKNRVTFSQRNRLIIGSDYIREDAAKRLLDNIGLELNGRSAMH